MCQVSVLMPMRNAARYVRAALLSVLSQRDVDFEVVVVDDGSTDSSPDLVRALGDSRVQLVSGPCGGISVALNRGLELARGQYVARCDADDCFPPHRLSPQVRWLDAHPACAAVAGSYVTMARSGQPIADADTGAHPADITPELRNGRTRTHLGTFMTRRAALRDIGGFRPYFVTAEDIDLQLRLGEHGSVWYEPTLTYQHRLHDDSITYSMGVEARAFYERTARHFQQQRKAGGGDDLDRNCPPLPPESLVSPPSSSSGQIQSMLLTNSWREHRSGHRLRALSTGWRAVMTKPGNVRAWTNLGALALRRPKDEA
jgi:glycosyltransferase involved in cell wall biosynthesis